MAKSAPNAAHFAAFAAQLFIKAFDCKVGLPALLRAGFGLAANLASAVPQQPETQAIGQRFVPTTGEDDEFYEATSAGFTGIIIGCIHLPDKLVLR